MTESDRQLRQLVDALPRYEEQIRYWESQLEAISNVKTDIFQAQDTMKGMLDSKHKIVFAISLTKIALPKPLFPSINDECGRDEIFKLLKVFLIHG